MKEETLLFTGDFVIDENYELTKVDSNVIDFFNSSRYNFVNLEAPVSKTGRKIIKTGPHLKLNEASSLKVLKALNINYVTLANNHVLDYGGQGVKETINFCVDNDIEWVGAGNNLNDARETKFIDTNHGVVAVVNIAENEWSSADENSPGAHPYDLIENCNRIKSAKDNAKFVILVIHGGHEYFNLPSPRMQKEYRYFAEQGVDLIIGHHTHCISGYEEWCGVPIYYSLGNFLFTNDSEFLDWYTGLILEVKIKNEKLETNVHPIRQSKTHDLKILTGVEKEEVMSKFIELSSIIADSSKLYKKWDEFVEFNYLGYLRFWSPLTYIKSKFLRTLFQKLRLLFLNKQGIKLRYNLIRCESHLDISKAVMDKMLRK